MFSPEFGDIDGDGLADLLTGADCCSSFSFYVFRKNSTGGFQERMCLTVLPKFKNSELGLFAKEESCPFVVDWNHDGQMDLVLLASC